MTSVQARGLTCPNCGAAIQLRSFQFVQSVVCDRCLATLDASDANVAVLQKFDERTRRYVPLLPLGSRGTWKGEPWEVIGFQVRQITADGTDYHWQEYLLFNPFRGFRYLSEYEGHWNDIVPVRGIPEGRSESGRPTATWRGTTFKRFQTSIATTIFALGEFPWTVNVGDVVTVKDHVAPPFLLSAEETVEETTWSMGEYVAGERLRLAFKLPAPFPAARGVFANQPNPLAGTPRRYWRAFALLLMALVVLVGLRRATATNRNVTQLEGVFHPGTAADQVPFVSDTFMLGGRTSSVEISTAATVDGSWLFLGMTLVNDETGQIINVGREVSYYYGVDDGESWTEGSRSDAFRLGAVPPGRWFLRMELDGPDAGRPIDWRVEVRRDSPGLIWWAVAFALLILPPAVVSLRATAFETTRWAESDYAPASSGDSGDSDSSSDD